MTNHFNLAVGFGLAISLVVSGASDAQEQVSPLPGVTTLGERTIPAPAGLSPEMLQVVKERQFPPIIPAPRTTEQWLELQKQFDAPGDAHGRKGAEYNGATYQVREIAGVRTYYVTPKKINTRFADRVFVHTHGGAWVFGGGDSALREAVWLAHGVGVKVVAGRVNGCQGPVTDIVRRLVDPRIK